MTIKVKTKRYLLRVRNKADEDKDYGCYGLDEIAIVHKVIKPKQLQRFFQEVKLEELVRPKEIELIISHQEGGLAPQSVKVVGDLVLWESPLEKTKTHFACSI